MKKLLSFLLIICISANSFGQKNDCTEKQYPIWSCEGYTIYFVNWEVENKIEKQSSYDYSVNAEGGIDEVLDVIKTRNLKRTGDGEVIFEEIKN